MGFVRDWINPQLTYLNLKKDSTKNMMATEEIEKIWTPWTIFDNIESGDAIAITDEPDSIKIIANPEFRFERDGRTNFQNTRLFKGSENVMRYKKEKTINWVCVYNMRWYPFDTQLCALKMFPSESSVSLKPTRVKYKGPVVLPQHYVKGVNICSHLIKDVPGIIVEVTLGRPLTSTVLSVFMPTTIILVLSQLVTVFGKHYIEMVIEVNLTLLLVLATL